MATMSRHSNKLQTREKLLDQGVALLMEQGYHGSGLQGILQSVGVPKGSFYYYFSSKEALSAEVIRHYITPFIDTLEAYLGRPDLSALKALELYFQWQIDESRQRAFRGGCLLGNLMGEVGETSETCRAALLTAVHRYRDKLAEAIARAQQEGELRQDLPAEAMADLLVNAWQGALLRMKIELSVAPLEACCQSLLGGYFRP
jgi:TetR/AcrR family transcriptional regulator, transcriptional repressor for nem operon